MTQEQLRADVATLRKVAESAARPEARAFLTRILAIVEPLAGLSDEQVASLREENERRSRMRRLAKLEPQDADIWNAHADAYDALARMLGGGR